MLKYENQHVELSLRFRPRTVKYRLLELLATMLTGLYMAQMLATFAVGGVLFVRLRITPPEACEAQNVETALQHGGWIGLLVGAAISIPLVATLGNGFGNFLADFFIGAPFFGRFDPLPTETNTCDARTSTSQKTPPETSSECLCPHSTRPV